MLSISATGALERLFELALVLGEAMERGLAERGLTPARAELLWRLGRRGPLTQRELSQALQCTPRNVTGLVDALEADGFVRRGAHPTDRRATLVELTEQGQTAAAAMDAGHQQFAALLFADLTDADLTSFVAALDRVLVRLREAAAAGAGEPG